MALPLACGRGRVWPVIIFPRCRRAMDFMSPLKLPPTRFANRAKTLRICACAPLGMLDGEGVDRETMRRTLHKIMENWDWNNTWDWDYPMMAMTTARLGKVKRPSTHC